MKLNRNVAKVYDSNNAEKEEPVKLSASESLSFVWDLTREIFSLTKIYDVESRLQRNAIHIIRRKS